MGFPSSRPRRLRRTSALRDLVRETSLEARQLVLPVFVLEGQGRREEIPLMPGQSRMSADLLPAACEAALHAGVKAVILFGLPGAKDAEGSGAWDEQGVVPRAVRLLKKHLPELVVIADVCLCEYTDHGHCGVPRPGAGGGTIDNDASLPLLARAAVAQARAGADIIAPSDMMDGRVGVIRTALDGAGFTDIPILAYSAKTASAFYGPFREAAGSTPRWGDRRSYQMDPANGDEAMREIALDIEEGADMVMLKPALPCLDLIRRAKDRFGVPLAAYQVSGEYSMLVAAAGLGMIDRERAILETLLSIRRAGADLVLTYFAVEAARLLGD